MSELEVVRWSVDPDAPEGMRELLRHAAEAGPTQVELATLRARMAPQLAPRLPLAAAVLAARTIIVALLVAGAAIVAYVALRPDPRMAPVPVPVMPPVSVPVMPVAPVAPPAPVALPPPPIVIVVPPVAEPRPHVRVAPSKASAPPAPEPAVPPSPSAISEVALLEQARAALRGGDAAHAFALVEQDASSYPDGVLVEEREALAIEALIKLGRRDDAAAKWSKFATSYPRSNYRARLQRLIDERAP